jgi:hypothetical protein
MKRLLCGLAALGATGCGINEGDFVLYRVSAEPLAVSPACYYPDEVPPPSEANDTSTFRSSSTFAVYRTAEDTLILDINGAAIPGGESDEGYEFVGYQIDTTYLGMDNLEAKVSLVTTNRITMVVDGNSIEGDITIIEQQRCDFLTATPSPGLCEKVPDCERVGHYVGVQLDDTAVRNYVDKPNPI